jgi:hypothetical protein
MKIISFTGGLGAQIVSAAAYFYIEDRTPGAVGAHFGYFSKPQRIATPGVPNDVSHWKWELDKYELRFRDFYQPTDLNSSEVVFDGPEKSYLAGLGLADLRVKSRFPIGEEAFDRAHSIFGNSKFACVHIRRGDYVNVASFLVSDESFLRSMRFLPSILDNLLVISDSEISETVKIGLESLKINCVSIVGRDPYLAHCLMRLSTVLVCSNSQFSWTAAQLRSRELLTLYPSQHDSNPNSFDNQALSRIREFQVLTL